MLGTEFNCEHREHHATRYTQHEVPAARAGRTCALLNKSPAYSPGFSMSNRIAIYAVFRYVSSYDFSVPFAAVASPVDEISRALVAFSVSVAISTCSLVSQWTESSVPPSSISSHESPFRREPGAPCQRSPLATDVGLRASDGWDGNSFLTRLSTPHKFVTLSEGASAP
jgi:hypothetical protein